MSDGTGGKDGGRESRLKWSKRAEQHLRGELNLIARNNCQAEMKSFADCAKESGLMVVFSCRQHNASMNSCLSRYTNEDEFEKYRLMRTKELEEKGADAPKPPSEILHFSTREQNK